MVHQITDIHGLHCASLTNQRYWDSEEKACYPNRPIIRCTKTVTFTMEASEYTSSSHNTNIELFGRDVTLGLDDQFELARIVANFVANRAVTNKRKREKEDEEVNVARCHNCKHSKPESPKDDPEGRLSDEEEEKPSDEEDSQKVEEESKE